MFASVRVGSPSGPNEEAELEHGAISYDHKEQGPDFLEYAQRVSPFRFLAAEQGSPDYPVFDQ